MFCFGKYDRKCSKKGEIRVPAKWIEKDIELICIWCKDCLQQVEFLRFFYENKDLETFLETMETNMDYEILQKGIHNILEKRKIIALPKNFIMKNSTQQKEVVCLGIGNGFEIWRADEYYSVQGNSLEDMLDILSDEIEF